MARSKKWQSGSADLISVAVGMVILSIAAAGTAASMIYGREVMGRQERYKSAAYMLRQEMEKKVWELTVYPRAKESGALGAISLGNEELQENGERGTWNQIVRANFSMRRIREVYDPVIPDRVSYWVVTMDAHWVEPEMAGGRSPYNRQSRSISYTTAVANMDY